MEDDTHFKGVPKSQPCGLDISHKAKATKSKPIIFRGEMKLQRERERFPIRDEEI